MVRKQMTIEGRDKDNNTVWSYTTLEENIPQEVINRGLKIIETREQNQWVSFVVTKGNE